MSTSGSRTANAVPKPAGRSSSPNCRKPGAWSANGGVAPSGRAASVPSRHATPGSGSAPSTRSVSSVQARCGSPGGDRLGPTIAPASADVVCAGGAAVRTSTRAPLSTSRMPVLRPLTPAPRTTTSGRAVMAAPIASRLWPPTHSAR